MARLSAAPAHVARTKTKPVDIDRFPRIQSPLSEAGKRVAHPSALLCQPADLGLAPKSGTPDFPLGGPHGRRVSVRGPVLRKAWRQGDIRGPSAVGSRSRDA